MADRSVSPSEAFALLRGNGQPGLFVSLAVRIASSPDYVRELIGYMVYGDSSPKSLPPRPPMREWIAMYRHHRAVQNGFGVGFGFPADMTASGFLDDIRSLSHMSQEEVAAEVAELSHDEMQDLIRPFIGIPFPPDDTTLRAMLNELDAEAEPDGPEDELQVDELIACPAGQFYFRVWWPCWILYREYPPRLMRAARLGDLDALDRLLRLDKYAVHDPGIARVLGDVMDVGSANARKQVVNALSGRPRVKLTDSGVRAGLAGLISQLAFLFHSKVTAPEIQALFDAVERVRGGSLTDRKIAAAGESWSKAVQRGRNWPSLPTGPAGQ